MNPLVAKSTFSFSANGNKLSFSATKNLLDQVKKRIGRVYLLDKQKFQDFEGMQCRSEESNDPIEIIEVLKKKGLKESEILSKIKECMKVMIKYFESIKDTIEVNVLEGVPELLEKLKNQNFLIGLVTGNLEPIGRGKIKKANLNYYFKLGGFGSDGLNIETIVKLAIKRAEKNFDFKLDNNVFFVGDAPQDVNAGNKAGVITVGVTTGIYTKEDLENATADYVVDNLQDT